MTKSIKAASTLGALSQRKASGKPPMGKGRAVKGIAYRCKIGQHSSCTAMSCACECGHRGASLK